MRHIVCSVGLVVMSVMTGGSPARAAQQVISTSFPMPVRAQLNLDASGCASASGPALVIDGGLALGGLGTDVFFRSDENGTRSAGDRPVESLVLFPAGQGIVIPRRPVRGGAGENPSIHVQLVGADGRPLTGPIAVGRCAPGVTTITADFFLPVTVSAAIRAQGCDSAPGPTVTMSGELALPGLGARLLFGDAGPAAAGPHPGDPPEGVVVAIVPPGRTIPIRKQVVMGGTGGNPWISALIRLVPGDAVSDEFRLGRCAQVVR